MNAQGIIRKISIGDIKEGITYKVGQRMMGDRILIEQILPNLEALESMGVVQYDIYVSEKDSDSVRLWKSFIGVPTSIEYDISLEADESV